MPATILHYTAHDLGDFAFESPVVPISCEGACGMAYARPLLVSRQGVLLCEKCDRDQDLLAKAQDVEPRFDGRCTKCSQILLSTDGRRYFAQCDACAAKQEISP